MQIYYVVKGNTFVILKFKAKVLRFKGIYFKDTCVNIIIMGREGDKTMESVYEASPITLTSSFESEFEQFFIT